MTVRTELAALAFLILSYPLASIAGRVEVIRQFGAVDPASYGWFFNRVVPTVIQGPIDDLALPAWQIEDLSTDSGSRGWWAFLLGPAVAERARDEGWCLDAQVSVTNEFGEGDTQFIAYMATSQTFRLMLRQEPMGVTRVTFVSDIAPSPSFITAPGVFHDYRLVFDPATQTADLWVDGVEVISDQVGELITNIPGPRFGVHEAGKTGSIAIHSLSLRINSVVPTEAISFGAVKALY